MIITKLFSHYSNNTKSPQSPKERKEKVKSLSSPTLCDPMNCNLPGSFVHGIFQARVLEWVATALTEFQMHVGYEKEMIVSTLVQVSTQ